MNVTIGFPTSENLYKLKITSLASTLSVQGSWIEFGTLWMIVEKNGYYHQIRHPRKPPDAKNGGPSSFHAPDNRNLVHFCAQRERERERERERGTEFRRNTKARDFVSLKTAKLSHFEPLYLI